MKILKLILLFLLINFASLSLGSWLMDNGPQSLWYMDLNKAPWTPAGWVFGFAWTLIMICFSIYLAFLFKDHDSWPLRGIFIFQVIFNVSWNYVFFNQHLIFWGLVVISILFLIITYLFFKFRIENMRKARFLLMPYLLWLIVAISLNAYIFLEN